MDNAFLLNFVSLVIFSQMLMIGVTHPFEQYIRFWHQPVLVIRSLLAVIVLVPLVVALLLWLFNLPPAVATGLAVLAAAPGAPLTTKRAQMAAGDPDYAASLQLTLAAAAVVVTPLILAILHAIFELRTERVSPLEMAQQIAVVTFLPVVIGRTVQHFAPRLTEIVEKPLVMVANGLFILLVVVILGALALAPDMRAMLQVGWLAIVAIVIMVVVSLAVGHLLGGPKHAQRTSLAIASIARNIGLAIFIASLNDVGVGIVPTIVVYTILGAIIAIPYAIWSKRQTS